MDRLSGCAKAWQKLSRHPKHLLLERWLSEAFAQGFKELQDAAT